MYSTAREKSIHMVTREESIRMATRNENIHVVTREESVCMVAHEESMYTDVYSLVLTRLLQRTRESGEKRGLLFPLLPGNLGKSVATVLNLHDLKNSFSIKFVQPVPRLIHWYVRTERVSNAAKVH